MPTAVGTESSVVHLLNNLIQLDYDAIAAYELAMTWSDSGEIRRHFGVFRDDHARHVETLGALMRRLDHTPPTGPDSQMLLTTGQVRLAAPFGERAVLRAMALNEEDTRTAYTRSVGHKGLAADIEQALERARADEERHSAWIADTLEAMPASRGWGRLLA